ncbi:MAG: hypothetical protein JWO31_271, partial [Phycisphaerales bacterium]|nr:hypothetical protein [Phycisphaerales bacterium]
MSGYHCELVTEGHELFVVDGGSTNGTFINGRRIDGRAPVTARDRIMLGDRGPLLAASMHPAGTADDVTPTTEWAPTTILGEAVGSLGAWDEEVTSREPPAVAGRHPVPEPVGLLDAPVDPPDPDRPAPSSNGGGSRAKVEHPSGVPAPLAGKTSVGMGTLMTELNRVARRERRRMLVIGVPLAVAVAVGVAFVVVVRTGRGIGGGQAGTGPPAGQSDWASVLGPRKSAVYLVVRQRPGKADRGLGTAWAAAGGRLATNAHVAETFAELEPGESLVARSNTSPPIDLKVTGVTVHPAYVEFERLRRAHLPLDAETGRPLSYPAPYDVALMSVNGPADPAHHAAAGGPLEIADAPGLARLVEPAEVAYVGFPMEASVEQGVNVAAPVAHQFVGNLSRKTDIFLAAAPEPRANFLQYTLVVQGGASGSPVFARDGRVVGLISGNDHSVGGQAGGRIAITGKSFGPRADAVRDLLDGTAADRVAAEAPLWRSHFRSLFDRAAKAGRYDEVGVGRTFAAFEALSVARAAAAPAGPRFDPQQARNVRRWLALPIDGPGPAHALVTTTPAVDEAGVYCVVVTTNNPDLLPRLDVAEADAATAAL